MHFGLGSWLTVFGRTGGQNDSSSTRGGLLVLPHVVLVPSELSHIATCSERLTEMCKRPHLPRTAYFLLVDGSSHFLSGLSAYRFVSPQFVTTLPYRQWRRAVSHSSAFFLNKLGVPVVRASAGSISLLVDTCYS